MICQTCHAAICDKDAFCFSCGAPQHMASLNPASHFSDNEKVFIDQNLKKRVRKAKRNLDSERVRELDALMNQHEDLLKLYGTQQRRKTERISQVESCFKDALRRYEERVNDAEQNLKRANEYLSLRISKLKQCVLYRDRVVVKNAMFPLDSMYDVRIETTGSVYESIEVKHSARPTLTRIVAGGLVAGPVGAVIGGAAQKHKLSSQNETHDDRETILIVLSNCGSRSASFPYSLAPRVRDFADKVRTAVADYDNRRQIAEDLIEKAEAHLREMRGSTQEIDQIYASWSAEREYDFGMGSIINQMKTVERAILMIVQ